MSRAEQTSDRLKRRVIPYLISSLSRITWPSRTLAAVRRVFGRSGRVELYFAFDDPPSAYAVIDLADRLAGRQVIFDLAPVVRRGIGDDPAVEDKRRYAVVDGRRLGRRIDLTLSRSAPIAPQDTAFLAGWVAAAPRGPALTRFCVEACRQLWFHSDGPVLTDDYVALWRECLGGESPSESEGVAAVRKDEARMKHRGPYDTPAAWVHGQWFFAQDRSAQIADRLDDLGWTVSR